MDEMIMDQEVTGLSTTTIVTLAGGAIVSFMAGFATAYWGVPKFKQIREQKKEAKESKKDSKE